MGANSLIKNIMIGFGLLDVNGECCPPLVVHPVFGVLLRPACRLKLKSGGQQLDALAGVLDASPLHVNKLAVAVVRSVGRLQCVSFSVARHSVVATQYPTSEFGQCNSFLRSSAFKADSLVEAGYLCRRRVGR